MIYPTNKRSAQYAIAEWIYKNGPAKPVAIVNALTEKFSDRTIGASIAEMKRVQMLAPRIDDSLALTLHIATFFDKETREEEAVEAAPLPPPFRKDWREGTLKPRAARPIRAGAEDYKRWPSVNAPFKKEST